MALPSPSTPEQQRFTKSINHCGLARVFVFPSCDQYILKTGLHNVRGLVIDYYVMSSMSFYAWKSLYVNIESRRLMLIIDFSDYLDDYTRYVNECSRAPHRVRSRLVELFHTLPQTILVGPNQYFDCKTKQKHPFFPVDEVSPEVSALWKATVLGDIDYMVSHQDQLSAIDDRIRYVIFRAAYMLGHLPLIQFLLPKSRFNDCMSPYFCRETDMNRNIEVLEFFLEWGISVDPHLLQSPTFRSTKAACYLTRPFLPVMDVEWKSGESVESGVRKAVFPGTLFQPNDTLTKIETRRQWLEARKPSLSILVNAWMSPCTHANKPFLQVMYTCMQFRLQYKWFAQKQACLPASVMDILSEYFSWFNPEMSSAFMEVQQLFIRVLIATAGVAGEGENLKAVVHDFQSHPHAFGCLLLNQEFFQLGGDFHTTFKLRKGGQIQPQRHEAFMRKSDVLMLIQRLGLDLEATYAQTGNACGASV